MSLLRENENASSNAYDDDEEDLLLFTFCERIIILMELHFQREKRVESG
jgi:hypothetical protein